MKVSVVKYPSDIFMLDKIHILPFERFAFNTLDVGVFMLNHGKHTEELEVDLSLDEEFCFDVFVDRAAVGVARYVVCANVFTPPMLMGLCYHCPIELLDEGEFKVKFDNYISLVHQVHSKSLSDYPAFTNDLFESIDLRIESVAKCLNVFDVCTKFIVYHEIAHAYIRQLTKRKLSDAEYRSFEFVADLMAVEWVFGKIVQQTPDTAKYRELAGYTSYKESILQNSLVGLDSFLSILMCFAFSGSFWNGKSPDLRGGPRHPHSLLRGVVHYTHFITLVESKYKFLTKEEIAGLADFWSNRARGLQATGLIDVGALRGMGESMDDLKRVPLLIREYKIERLEKFVPVVEGILARVRKGGSMIGNGSIAAP